MFMANCVKCCRAYSWYTKRVPIVLLCVAFCYAASIFVKNAWVTEDAYIIFRSIEQLFAGNGPVWNPNERVQVYTSPLWYFVLALARIFSDDVFLNTIIVSFSLYLATIVIIKHILKNNTILICALLIFTASTAFHDYTSSGLENVLAYFLISSFLYFYLEIFECEGNFEGVDNALLANNRCRMQLMLIIFGLIICVRHDLLLLFLPPTIFAISRKWKIFSARKWGGVIMIAFLPLILYSVFSLIYYGFPFPNTAYAKLNTGIDKIEIINQGLDYFYSSFLYDSITLIVIFAALVLVFFRFSKSCYKFLALGIIFNLIYVCYVGGDFMQGRFFSYAYLVSVILLSFIFSKHYSLKSAVICFAMIFIYLIFYPHTPANSFFDYENYKVENGIADERGYYFRELSLYKYLLFRGADQNEQIFPNHSWVKAGDNFRNSSNQVIVNRNIGVFGYYSGTEKTIIDPLALSDPLLARMPVTGWWRIGHFLREIPDGYISSIKNGNESLFNPRINEYYKNLKIITESESLLSFKRLKTILLFNIGAYGHLLSDSYNLYVSGNGKCGNHSPCYSTIQAAVNAAKGGDLIKVKQGKYSESPANDKTAGLRISGGWNNSFSGQSGVTEMYAPKTTGTSSLKLLPNIRLIAR